MNFLKIEEENSLEEIFLFIQQALNAQNAGATDDDFKTKNGTLSVKITG